jgi:hypothetical protein
VYLKIRRIIEKKVGASLREAVPAERKLHKRTSEEERGIIMIHGVVGRKFDFPPGHVGYSLFWPIVPDVKLERE